MLLSFDQPFYLVNEEDISVQICVTLNGTIENAISVNISTSDDTAEGK